MMTTTTANPAKDMRTPEALASARAKHPDAVRASYVTFARPGRPKDMIGRTIRVGGVPAIILRCRIDDISAEWDSGDRGTNGYRVHVIASRAAAAQAQ